MATFLTAYNTYVKPIEGGYAFVAGDKGGETYAGIARNYWPSWGGWPTIDAKKKLGAIKNNTKFPELDALTTQFYQDMWNKNRFGEFNDQKIADIVFDWFVNSGSNAFNTKGVETYGLDEILVKKFGKNVPVDSKNDTATIQAANSVDSTKLFQEIVNARDAFYRYLVTSNPTQAKFLEGWLKRLSKFGTVSVAAAGGGILLVVGLFFLARYLYKESKKGKKK